MSKETPLKPMVDHWAVCPTCEKIFDFDQVDGYIPVEDCIMWWVGPSVCPHCGQALDMSELNEEDVR